MATRFVAVISSIAVALVLLQPAATESAVRQKTKLSVQVSDKTPSVGQKVWISGTVKPRKAAGKKRRVKLQRRVDGTWRTVSKTKARKRGYRFTVTQEAVGKLRYRVKVAKARGVKWRAKRFTLTTRGLPSSVTASYSKRRVKVGAKVRVRGAVTGAAEGRLVTLYRALPSGPLAVRSTRVSAAGRYNFQIPTGFLVNHNLFVRVSATATHAAADSTPRKFTVLPNWKLQGKASAWRSISEAGRHVRVNPCATVPYRVNLAAVKPKARKAALRDLKAATTRITRATGIRFKRVGNTRFIPEAKKAANRRYPANTTLVISWARQNQTKLSFARAVGWGGGGAVPATSATGAPVWLRTQGWVLIEHPSRIPNGFANGARRGPLLMHEIGHVIGLQHPSAKNQIMSATLNPKITSRWGAGDLRGLRAKGIDHGCISRPAGARISAATVELEPHPGPYAGHPRSRN